MKEIKLFFLRAMSLIGISIMLTIVYVISVYSINYVASFIAPYLGI